MKNVTPICMEIQNKSGISNTDIYNYLQPIVSGCGAFIKSSGFMMVQHDVLVMMSYDRAFLSVVQIKPLNLIYIAEISTFMKCKNDPEHFMENSYFLGGNAIYYEMEALYINYWETINVHGDTILEYHEEDIYNIPNFKENISTSGFRWSSFSANGIQYKLMVSKSIFPLNKDDSCSVSIFNMYQDNTRVLRYRVYKKKLKLYVDIFTRQYVFCATG